jgi:hypothetical protein
MPAPMHGKAYTEDRWSRTGEGGDDGAGGRDTRRGAADMIDENNRPHLSMWAA